ncbi:hypothetical protein LTR94_031458 [Friedmanniomyces endolithicus]|nr:hypothetical protein LTR94_031458 [Friedmanniomyces endolithicus]
MIGAMIDRLTMEGASYRPDSHAARLARVLLDELAAMPHQRFNLPVSANPKISAIADALTSKPSDRATQAEWAKRQMHLVIALRELAGGASVQAVAAELGYGSVNAFITMFQKALGTTPARFFSSRREKQA